MKKKILMFGFLIPLISFVSAHAGDSDGAFDGHGMMGGFCNWGMGFFGGFFMILVIIALVLLIVWLTRQIQAPNKRGKKR